MKHEITVIVSIVFCFIHTGVWSQTTTGREYHVAKTGRNTGMGSNQDPFLTISYAAQKAEPGDKVIIHRGTYREQVFLPHGGNSESSRITFTAAPGEQVIVKGSEQVSFWEQQGKGVWKAKIPGKIFGGFNPFDTVVNGQKNFHLGEVYVNGNSYSEQQMQDSVICGPKKWFAKTANGVTSICVNLGKSNPTKSLVEINVRPAAFLPATGVSYITIDGISICQIGSNRASVDGEQPGAISTGGGAHWIIQNCKLTDAKCVAISLAQPGGHDLSRNNYNRPAFGEFEDVTMVGHHIIRNNVIRRCGQAGIFGLLHGTASEIYNNQIEDINGVDGFSKDDVCGIRLAVAVDAIVRHNLIRRIRNGSGIMLGPLYQGTRITENVIYDIKSGSALLFYRSHGLALIDNNVLVGSGTTLGEGIKLEGAEANVFVHNLLADCSFVNESLPLREGFGTISYRPHSLVTKQTIPVLPLDNKWFNNIFIRGGLNAVQENHSEADFNAYMGGARKSTWADIHSLTVPQDGSLVLNSTPTGLDIRFDLTGVPPVKAPIITPDVIGRFALSQGLESPEGKAIKLVTDFFGNSLTTGVTGPFTRYQNNNTKTARLFTYRAGKEIAK